jgi:hypothetical protein
MKETPADNPSPSASSAPSAVTPSPEVQEAARAQRARKRQDALAEAHKILGVDVRNSAEQAAHFCAVDNDQQISVAMDLLKTRLAAAQAKIDEARL